MYIDVLICKFKHETPVSKKEHPNGTQQTEPCEAARRECGDGKWGPDDGATATAWVAYQKLSWTRLKQELL
jgi:hypothetical protein